MPGAPPSRRVFCGDKVGSNTLRLRTEVVLVFDFAVVLVFGVTPMPGAPPSRRVFCGDKVGSNTLRLCTELVLVFDFVLGFDCVPVSHLRARAVQRQVRKQETASPPPTAPQPHIARLAHRNVPSFHVMNVDFGEHQCPSRFYHLRGRSCIRAARRQKSNVQICSCRRSLCSRHCQHRRPARRVRQRSQQSSMKRLKDAIQPRLIRSDDHRSSMAQLFQPIAKSVHCWNRQQPLPNRFLRKSFVCHS